jgi:hypothetical protein
MAQRNQLQVIFMADLIIRDNPKCRGEDRRGACERARDLHKLEFHVYATIPRDSRR